MIRVGSAGWSYPDWDGIVYPARKPRGFDALAHIASFLDAIEINASFYRIPDRAAASSWVERIADRPDFRFTAKLWRGFTHEVPGSPEDAAEAERSFRAAMEPILAAGRLAAVLVQFPYSFHNTSVNRRRLSEILDRFADLPLVLEVRHVSWMRDEFLAWLRERSVGLCNVDQPALSANIPPTEHVTSRVAYARLHGRNSEAWFEEGAGRDRRYDYLYAPEDLVAWAKRGSAMAARAEEVFIIANNHYRGQGIANALELRSVLAGEPVPGPPEILAAFPRLEERVRATSAGKGKERGASQRILPLGTP